MKRLFIWITICVILSPIFSLGINADAPPVYADVCSYYTDFSDGELGDYHYDNGWLNLSRNGGAGWNGTGITLKNLSNPKEGKVFNFGMSSPNRNPVNLSFDFEDEYVIGLRVKYIIHNFSDSSPKGHAVLLNNDSDGTFVRYMVRDYGDYSHLDYYPDQSTNFNFVNNSYISDGLFDNDYEIVVGFNIYYDTSIGLYGRIGNVSGMMDYTENLWYNASSPSKVDELVFPMLWGGTGYSLDIVAVEVLTADDWYINTFYDDYGQLFGLGSEHHSDGWWQSESWDGNIQLKRAFRNDNDGVGWEYEFSTFEGMLKDVHLLVALAPSGDIDELNHIRLAGALGGDHGVVFGAPDVVNYIDYDVGVYNVYELVWTDIDYDMTDYNQNFFGFRFVADVAISSSYILYYTPRDNYDGDEIHNYPDELVFLSWNNFPNSYDITEVVQGQDCMYYFGWDSGNPDPGTYDIFFADNFLYGSPDPWDVDRYYITNDRRGYFTIDCGDNNPGEGYVYIQEPVGSGSAIVANTTINPPSFYQFWYDFSGADTGIWTIGCRDKYNYGSYVVTFYVIDADVEPEVYNVYVTNYTTGAVITSGNIKDGGGRVEAHHVSGVDTSIMRIVDPAGDGQGTLILNPGESGGKTFYYANSDSPVGDWKIYMHPHPGNQHDEDAVSITFTVSGHSVTIPGTFEIQALDSGGETERTSFRLGEELAFDITITNDASQGAIAELFSNATGEILKNKHIPEDSSDRLWYVVDARDGTGMFNVTVRDIGGSYGDANVERFWFNVTGSSTSYLVMDSSYFNINELLSYNVMLPSGSNASVHLKLPDGDVYTIETKIVGTGNLVNRTNVLLEVPGLYQLMLYDWDYASFIDSKIFNVGIGESFVDYLDVDGVVSVGDSITIYGAHTGSTSVKTLIRVVSPSGDIKDVDVSATPTFEFNYQVHEQGMYDVFMIVDGEPIYESTKNFQSIVVVDSSWLGVSWSVWLVFFGTLVIFFCMVITNVIIRNPSTGMYMISAVVGLGITVALNWYPLWLSFLIGVIIIAYIAYQILRG